MPTSVSRAPISPHLKRWMLFVDGENFTIRGQELIKEIGLTLEKGPYWSKDEFLWMRGLIPATKLFFSEFKDSLQGKAIRAHYYTSFSGSSEKENELRIALRKLGFQPNIFRKARKNQPAKGVDIALAKDFLSHAFLDNYDMAILIAGDGDYIPLIQEVQRLGKNVGVAFFEGPKAGLHSELLIQPDYFRPLDDLFIQRWESYLKNLSRK